MEQLLTKLALWATGQEKRIMIGISGHGAAGKTTFAQRLCEHMDGACHYVTTDPYIVTSAIRKYTKLAYTYEGVPYSAKITACHPAAHFVPVLERDVQMLRDGQMLRTIDAPYAPTELLEARPVTIVEGMTVAFTNPALYDLLIYFYTDGETELARRLGRDVTERGVEEAHLLQSHEDRRRQYALFMHPTSRQFHIVFQSTNDGLIVEKFAVPAQ